MKRKYYNYIPIFKRDEIPELTGFLDNDVEKMKRHFKRKEQALTELIAFITDKCCSKDVRDLYSKYDVKLIEDIDGSKTIGLSFPEKRF